MKFFNEFNFVNLVNSVFPRCFAECAAKAHLRERFDQFDDEQKLETAHHLCHQVGNYDLIVKLLLLAFIFQIIFFSVYFRVK